MIKDTTLYYYINKYTSIMPDTPPAADWYNSISANINSYLKYNYGLRELLTPSIDYLEDASETEILDWIKEKISLLFASHNESYSRIFEVFTSEYNPLWNVDGTETETHGGKDTTQNSGTDTVNNTGTDSRSYTGTDTNTSRHSGTDTTTETNSGTDTTTETNSGTDTTTRSVATFDSDTAFLADQSATLNGKGTTTALQHGHGVTSSLQHGETVTDTTEHGLTDALTHGHTIQTVNGKKTEETHGHTITTVRQGNIGVISSVKLLQEHLELWDGLSFIDIVARDIIKEITYSTIF